MESWCAWLLRWRVVHLSNLSFHVLVLLRAVVYEVALLSGHGVVIRVNTRLGTHHWSNDWLHMVLDLLLLVHVLRGDRRRSKLLLHLVSHSQVHALELLGSSLDIGKLLLEALLLLCKVHVGSYKLSIQIWVHLILRVLINVNLGWSKDLLWHLIHLAISAGLTVSVLEAGSLGATVILLLGVDAST